MSAVLKVRHSLLGKNLIPLIVEVRGAQIPPFWNRLKKEHPLEKYSPEELSSEFKKLSGETAEEILIMAGKSDPQHEDLLILMHCAIAYANSVGAPKGSPLQELYVNETPTGRAEAPKSPGTKKADKTDNVERRIETMEKELGNLRKVQGMDKVEESLKQVEYGVPRVWKPADLCATCKYPNDQGFNFCQACGLKGGLESTPITVDAATRARLSYLDNLLSSSSYSKKKSALQKEFSNFLCSRSQVGFLEFTRPSDICEFLVFKDRVGKTQIHDVSCGNLGKVGNFSCACPKGLSWGYVQSLVGQLKAIFESMGKGKLWDEVTMKGNPCSSLKVQRYVKAVKLEQSLAHVPVKQAKPLFFDKLQRIGHYISSLLKSGDLSVVKRFVFLRDQAFFKLQFFAGDRAGDLGKLISQEIKRLDDDSGFVFSHTVGKTLGNGKTNEFVVLRLDDEVVCPIKGLELYVESAGAMGIDLKKGFLFRPLDIHGKRVLNRSVTSSAMYYRLKFYLSELGVYEGETLHSIRGGCAVTLALSGLGSSEQIMDHVGWASTRSFQRYSRLGRITDRSSVAFLFKHVAETPENVRSLYDNYGSSNNLVSAFV